MRNALFYLGIGTLFAHELDAIANHEWRVMPILQSFSAEAAFTTFVLLHIPLFAVLIALVSSSNDRIRRLSRIGVSVFLLAHAGHEFDSLLSMFLIYGGAVFGGLYLVVSRREYLRSQ
jgi:hypothetical protein